MQKGLLVVVGIVIGGAAGWILSNRGPGFDVDLEAVARGESLYRVCAVCHGEHGGGNPDTQAPRIAGQHPWYLERQLQNFRTGIRGADSTDANGLVMRQQALTLADDRAVSDVAAYVATLNP